MDRTERGRAGGARIRRAIRLVGSLGLVALAASPVPALAACSLLVEDAVVRWRGGADRYDPFAGSPRRGEIEVLVRRGVGDAPPSGAGRAMGEGDGAATGPGGGSASVCAAAIALTVPGPSALVGPGGELRYELLDPTGDGGRTAIASLAPGDRTRLRFAIDLPPGQLVAAGRYAGTLVVRLVATVGTTDIRSATSGSFDGARRVPVDLFVESAASLSFAGTVTRATFVDLGDLRVGATTRLPVSLSVRSTSPYVLRFSSENGGALQQLRGGRVWRVPYTLYVAGRPISLGRDGGAVPSEGVVLGEERLPLDFVVGEVIGARSGRYTDRVRVEIVPGRL